MKFDVLITVAEKDFNKLPYVLKSIQQNIPNVAGRYVVSPVPVPEKDKLPSVYYYLDEEVFDYNISKIDLPYRRGWYRQQFIKLFQQVTGDTYLVVDADAYINRKIEVNGTFPVFYLGKDQLHLPYFECMKMLCGLERAYPHSFISEIMLFKRRLIQFLLKEQRKTIGEFISSCIDCINIVGHPSGFSEYEFYGNYVSSRMKGYYQYQFIKVKSHAKKRQWADKEIQDTLSKYSSSDFDIITMHSWL
jgi:hypothetical protein